MRSSTYNHASRQQRAFTVVELLVVIGIIVLLAGLILGMALRGKRQAQQARMQSDLQGIATALEAYKQDFGDYPRLEEAVTAANPGLLVPASLGGNPNAPDYRTGAEVLCWALIGPFPMPNSPVGFDRVDGNPGPGFRVRGTQGLVYGPYLNVETYHFGIDKRMPRYPVIQDMNGQPILYFGARSPRPGSTLFAGAGKNFLYDFRDNGIPFYRQQNLSDGTQALQRFQGMLGDMNLNGGLDAGETAINQGPFVLWGAGANEAYGPEDPTVSGDVKDCDDVLVPAQ